MRLEGYDLLSIRCVSADRTNVLLGRHVLNRFSIVLDGPNLLFEIKLP